MEGEKANASAETVRKLLLHVARHDYLILHIDQGFDDLDALGREPWNATR